MTRPGSGTREPGSGEKPRILIVDDEQSMREWMRLLFQRDGFEVLIAEDGVAARDVVTREYLDVVLTDIRMPRMDGVQLLKTVRELTPDAIVLMMTAHWSRDSTEWTEARELGAEALFEKPFRDVNLVTMQVRQLLESRRLRHENAVLRQTTADRGFAGIIGRSPVMLDVFRLVETVCRTNSTVLISGESGTGKELVARAIHTLSLRSGKPFVAVNCGAMPEALLESELFGHVRGAFTGADKDKKGLIEAADGGTVFLDEIGEMTPSMQVKLLRVLQERTYRRVGGTDEVPANIRIIAATNRALPKLVSEGKFREDLFYRLNVIPVTLPPLRERADDILLIAHHVLAKYAREMGRTIQGFTPEAEAALAAYPWPGNVRELENVIERAVALESESQVQLATLPENLRSGRPATAVGGAGNGLVGDAEPGFNLERHLQDIERSHLERALERSGGVQTRAADVLGLSFRQFRYLAKKHGLKMTRARWLAAVAAGVCALYGLRLDPAAGLYIDDAYYVVLAKALVTGDGYALISSAATPILPAFPPGFPLLLAPVVAVTQPFPGNVPWLKAVSIVAMLGVAAATYRFLIRDRGAPPWLAGAVALLTVATPAFVFLATSTVMAECAFTLGQMGVVLAVERASRLPPARAGRWVIVAAVIGAVTLLIRAAGVAPLAAAGLYLLAKRGWRMAAGFALVAAICYSPWLLYASAHRPTEAERMAHGGAVAYAYSDLLAMEKGGVAEGSRVDVAGMASRVRSNLVNVLGRDLGALIFPAAYRGPGESGLEVFTLSGETGLRAGSMGGGTAILWVSSGVSAIALVGFLAALRRGLTVAELIVPLTIAMVVFVPNRTFRYVLPLAPFVIYYFLTGLEATFARLRLAAAARPGAVPQIAVMCMLGLVGMEHAQYAWQARNGTAAWLRDYQEVQAVSGWMNEHLTGPGAVATTNPPLVYLLTGRKTVAFVDVMANWPAWQALGVRYAAALHVTEQPPERLGYRLRFKSPRLGLWVLELPSARLTESASRP